VQATQCTEDPQRYISCQVYEEVLISLQVSLWNEKVSRYANETEEVNNNRVIKSGGWVWEEYSVWEWWWEFSKG